MPLRRGHACEILRIYKKFIASSSNNIFYIQIQHFTQQTMLNQTLYYTLQYLEPNTKSKRGGYVAGAQ